MTDRDTIMNKISESLLETLGVDEDEIVPEANFYFDLGGESIDLLDLTFRLDRFFDVKMNFQELEPLWKLDEEGRLSPGSIDAMRERWPILTDEEVHAITDTGDWHGLLTVSLIERLVLFRIENRHPAQSVS